MSDLQIKMETFASRCEVCHQTDYFDPTTNICKRCNKTSVIKEKEKLNVDPKKRSALNNLENQTFTNKHFFKLYLVVMVIEFPAVFYLLSIYNRQFLSTFYLPLIPSLLCIILISLNIKNVKRAVSLVGDTIKTDQDLSIIKQVINFNMMIAICMFGIMISYIILLYILSSFRFITSSLLMIHVIAFSLISINLALFNARFDKMIKTFKVDSKDPKLAETYERWNKQWQEARFRLPD